MPTDLTIQALADRIDLLTSNISKLTSAYEDVVAWNIAEKAQKHLFRGVVAWASIVTVAIGLAGWKGWDEIVLQGTKSGRLAAERKFQQVYEKQYNQRALQSLAKMDGDLAKAMAEARDEVNLQLKAFAMQVGEATKRPEITASVARSLAKAPPSVAGYAYYGIYSGGANWADRNFKNLSRGPAEPPIAGDLISALVPVNARKNAIQYDAQRGWLNGPIVGALRTGQQVKVIDVQQVVENYIWIHFQSGQ